MWIIPEAVNTVKKLLMMSKNIARNMQSNQGTINYPTQLHLVGHFHKLYHDARNHECQVLHRRWGQHVAPKDQWSIWLKGVTTNNTTIQICRPNFTSLSLIIDFELSIFCLTCSSLHYSEKMSPIIRSVPTALTIQDNVAAPVSNTYSQCTAKV